MLGTKEACEELLGSCRSDVGVEYTWFNGGAAVEELDVTVEGLRGGSGEGPGWSLEPGDSGYSEYGGGGSG